MHMYQQQSIDTSSIKTVLHCCQKSVLLEVPQAQGWWDETIGVHDLSDHQQLCHIVWHVPAARRSHYLGHRERPQREFMMGPQRTKIGVRSRFRRCHKKQLCAGIRRLIDRYRTDTNTQHALPHNRTGALVIWWYIWPLRLVAHNSHCKNRKLRNRLL